MNVDLTVDIVVDFPSRQKDKRGGGGDGEGVREGK